MPLDHNERLRAEVAEKFRWDQKQKVLNQYQASKKQQEEATYEGVQAANPGKPVYACVVLLACPWKSCTQIHLVMAFMTWDMGHDLFLRCPNCIENFMTLRDTVRVYGTNTFPIQKLQKSMRRQAGNYHTWMNILRLAHAAMDAELAKQYTQNFKREHEITFGEGGKDPIKLEVSTETPEQAREEMRVSKTSTGAGSHRFTSMTEEDYKNFETDPEAGERWTG